MALSKIGSDAIVNDAIGPTQLDESANYTFTGTVTGAGGITEVDQYMLQGDVTISGAWTLLNNWKRTDFNFEKIGTGITNTSGTFSFPSTGKYYIQYIGKGYHASASVWGGIKTQVTINNSTYTDRSVAFQQYVGGGQSITVTTTQIVDVTDISNVKMRFYAGADSGTNYWSGAADQIYTHINFIKLGDT